MAGFRHTLCGAFAHDGYPERRSLKIIQTLPIHDTATDDLADDHGSGNSKAMGGIAFGLTGRSIRPNSAESGFVYGQLTR